MRPEYWEQACHELAERDAVLARLLQQYPGECLEGKGDAFITLARSIVGQQISVKAAETIWGRLAQRLGEVSSHALLTMAEADLQACGLSSRKVAYLQDLSHRHVAGQLSVRDWLDRDDEAVIAELITIKGIGRWTAEMFLIFHLLRPNVLPLDDIGLQRAMAQFYNHGDPISKLKMREIARALWQPWSSVATWYLWRSLDPLPVAY
ncbi:DNA-3-methyladenine glycosylase family protein [Parachitinimonas caeni]|uniref:DNA-3-methyladenine glycosylase II n=1 Tax=Parachitinimonas caeni TaxID=3031301 RepID=A0ABT7DZD7_9NEIS|nr:DNA-3-methyladenine glycosylase [Parachitinimonas caeni]MDK2125413.1 DNA-3-methyladenine glycosylase [Parachitinimonas caeni]